jgi:thiamine kinase-like enzyme
MACLATTALGLDGQRPAIGETLRSFQADLGDRLQSLPRRPGELGDELVPVHGDLAPWNLRRTSRGLALFDWEAAGWGHSGADLAHYRGVCEGLRRRRRR